MSDPIGKSKLEVEPITYGSYVQQPTY